MPGKTRKALFAAITRAKDTFTVLVGDLDSLVEEQAAANKAVSTALKKSFHDYYHNMEQIQRFLDMVVKRNPEIASLVTVGKTHEGRDIVGVRIEGKKEGNHQIIINSGSTYTLHIIAYFLILSSCSRMVPSPSPLRLK